MMWGHWIRTRLVGRAPWRGACALAIVATGSGMAGCASSPKVWKKTVGNNTSEVAYIAAELDAPAPPVIEQVAFAGAPMTATTADSVETLYLERSLGEVIEQALIHSEVFRDLGGVVLRSPDTVQTNLANSLQQTDPQFSQEAALSEFDATLSASSTFSNNDRIFNNAFFAGGTTGFQQDLHEHQIELSKRSATGSTMALRLLSEYDNNNAPANTFFNAYQSQVEGELRQPLLQGAGLEFNRIAGPNATPGVYNGVLIARTNFDISNADFEIALRDFISNVENAYWDLYLSYRELDAKKKAMEQALVLWNEAKSQASGEIANKAQEALARQQYFRLKAEVDDALSGRLLNGTQTRNGSSGGTLQGTGGVLATERRLRLMIGLPANDGTLIRPSDEPPMTKIPFNWDVSLDEAMAQRPELMRQNASVKKREMELLAAGNFLNPRLDAVGRYRYRGFGDDLFGAGDQSAPAPASAFGQMITGNNQEWSLGVELSMPVGYRQAHAAVTHAQLALSRARSIQKEQQREIVSNLSGAFVDSERSYQQIENKLNQYVAAREYYLSLKTQKEEQGLPVSAFTMIDAIDRLVRAETEFFRSRTEYAVSLKNIHYEKGTILRYKDLRVAGAYADGETDYAIPTDPTPADDLLSEADESVLEGLDVPGSTGESAELETLQFPDFRLELAEEDLKPVDDLEPVDGDRPTPVADTTDELTIDLTSANTSSDAREPESADVSVPEEPAVEAPDYNPLPLPEEQIPVAFEWSTEAVEGDSSSNDEDVFAVDGPPKRPAPAPPETPATPDDGDQADAAQIDAAQIDPDAAKPAVSFALDLVELQSSSQRASSDGTASPVLRRSPQPVEPVSFELALDRPAAEPVAAREPVKETETVVETEPPAPTEAAVFQLESPAASAAKGTTTGERLRTTNSPQSPRPISTSNQAEETPVFDLSPQS